MKISFDTIAESAIENFKGGEGTFHVHMFQDMNNKIMKGRLVPGSSIGTHTHVECSFSPFKILDR